MEMKKPAAETVETEQQRWLKFFTEGERLDEANLPEWMQTPEMRQAMNTLKAFSDDDRAYQFYQERQNALQQRRSLQSLVAEERAAREADRQAKEAALQEIEAELRARNARRQAEAAEDRAKEAALREIEAERQAKEAALREIEVERQAKEAALAEVERLKALLRDRMPPAGS